MKENKKYLLAIIVATILIIGIPIVIGWIIPKESFIEGFKDTNDWIGFFGSYSGSIIGGIITLIVMKETNKTANKNVKDSIDETKKIQLRNEVNSFCNDIISTIAIYCEKTRDYQGRYNTYVERAEDYTSLCNETKKIVEEAKKMVEEAKVILDDDKLLDSEVLKIKEKMNIDIEKIQQDKKLALQRYDTADGNLEILYIAPYFELMIKLQDIELASGLVSALRIHSEKFVEETDYSVIYELENNIFKKAQEFVKEYSKKVEL